MREVELFEEMPHLQSDRIVLREMVEADAEALASLTADPTVYRFLPTYLYEQQHADKRAVIANMRRECFDTHESILLAVCERPALDAMLGIAEIYHYRPAERICSIGNRLGETAWGRGIATEVTSLLKRYLVEEAGIQTITAHVMVENGASARVLEKNGFRNCGMELWEDWGFGDPVEVERFIYEA